MQSPTILKFIIPVILIPSVILSYAVAKNLTQFVIPKIFHHVILTLSEAKGKNLKTQNLKKNPKAQRINMTFKDSGIEWLGEIPEHWEVVKIKHIAKKLIGGGTPDTSISDYWGSDKSNSYLWVSIEDITKSSFIRDTSRRITQKGLEASSAKIIPPFSILYSIYASLGKIAYSDLPVTTNQAILAIQPKKEIFYKFLFYILHSTTKNIIMLSSTTTQNNISLLIVQNLKIPLPPIEKQKAIADFLDSKCKQIESFVDKKQKLITLLNEKKQALINECVTKGLSAICHCKALTRHSKDSPSCHSEDLAEESHPACHSERSEESKNIETQDTESRCFAIAQHDRIEYKDSGIEHLGKIPSHWEVRRLATFGKFSKGGNISRQDLVENGEQALLYGDIYMNYEISTSFLDSKISENTSLGATPIYRGDILFAGSGETKEDIGKNIVYLGNDRAFVGGDVIIFRQKENNALFLSYALNTKYAKFYKGIESKGEIIVHIYASNLKDIKIPLPPIEEQKQIAQFLDSEISKIDSIIGKIKKQIELIKEYKNSLINQAVCGKVGVQKGKR